MLKGYKATDSDRNHYVIGFTGHFKSPINQLNELLFEIYFEQNKKEKLSNLLIRFL